MKKYYLLEKYGDNISHRYHTYTTYEIREFKTLNALKKAFLKGPQHNGKLIPTEGLEFKITAKETAQKLIKMLED